MVCMPVFSCAVHFLFIFHLFNEIEEDAYISSVHISRFHGLYYQDMILLLNNQYPTWFFTPLTINLHDLITATKCTALLTPSKDLFRLSSLSLYSSENERSLLSIKFSFFFNDLGIFRCKQYADDCSGILPCPLKPELGVLLVIEF